MARLMLAWELGTGLGHVMPLAQLAGALLDRGHEVHLAWKDLAQCRDALQALFDHSRLKIWQAPVWQRALHGRPDASTYPELLLRGGYADSAGLSACARAWRGLIDAIEPDLLLADYAPTAMLAARETSTRVATFGNGFFIPPARSPMPVFRDWEPVDQSLTDASQALVLTSCNSVLQALGKKPLTAIHELLQVDEHFLLGWPEFDHYGPLRGEQPLPSWGWPSIPFGGLKPDWPTRAGPRLFAYLLRHYASIDAVLTALHQGPWSTLLYLAGASDREASELSCDRLMVVNHPVDLLAAFETADLLICHAGSGTLYSALQSGLPALMLPSQSEQLLLAQQVAASGAGIVLWPNEVDRGFETAANAMLASPGFRDTAQAIAARHGGDCDNDMLQRIADRCDALIKGKTA